MQRVARRPRRDPQHRYLRAVHVRELLHDGLLAAGVPGLASLIDEQNPTGDITLPKVSIQHGAVLAALLRHALGTEFSFAGLVREAFEVSGVALDVRVIDCRISLGELDVVDADWVAVRLGAPAKYDHVDGRTDFDSRSVADDVAARLEDMVSEILGDCLGTDFHPTCVDHGGQLAIRLGTLNTTAAQKLASALNPNIEVD